MALLEIDNLYFRYPDEPVNTINGINLQVQEGELIVLCGSSGCGKTTLLKHLKRELEPVGIGSGNILYRGKPLHDLPLQRSALEIGMLFQDPDQQIVTDQVLRELAFTLENQGTQTFVIRQRIAELSQFLDLEPLLYRKTDTLSGGQKQLLNLASVLLQKPSLLLLDEPTAQLDPIAAQEFLHMMQRLNQDYGITVIITEHRLEEVIPFADRVYMMERGKFTRSGETKQLISELWDQQLCLDYIPSISKLYLTMEESDSFPADNIPLVVKEGRHWLHKRLDAAYVPNQSSQSNHSDGLAAFSRILVHSEELDFRYGKTEGTVLHNLSFDINENDLLAIFGGNGSGKSTFLQIVAGLLKPQRGKVVYNGLEREDIAYLPQNPLLYFIHDTVEQELLQSANRFDLKSKSDKVREWADRFGITSLLNRHPYDCSGGERQKAALASVLIRQPKLLLIDEPTKGLDPEYKQEFASLLAKLHCEGLTIAMVTHDLEFAAHVATRCALLFDGSITAEGKPQEFFCGNDFYTTIINRCVRGKFPQALMIEDVVRAWR